MNNYIFAEDYNKIIHNVIININNVIKLIKRNFYVYNIIIIIIINKTFINTNKIKMIALYIRNLFKHILNDINLIANNDEELTFEKDNKLLINDNDVKQKKYDLK